MKKLVSEINHIPRLILYGYVILTNSMNILYYRYLFKLKNIKLYRLTRSTLIIG